MKPTAGFHQLYGPEVTGSLPALPSGGLVVVTDPGRGGGDLRIGITAAGLPLWWVNTDSADAIGLALLLGYRPGTRAIALAPVAAPARQAALAVEVSLRLHAHRLAWLGTADVPVTCPTPPPTPPAMVRIPHLITAVNLSGRPRDRIIWELIALEDAETIHGQPLPSRHLRQALEAHLPELLRLREQVRRGYLPYTPVERAVAELCVDGLFGIHTLYRHAHLLVQLLDAEHDAHHPFPRRPMTGRTS